MSWMGSDPSLQAVMLNSHVDVVPVFPVSDCTVQAHCLQGSVTPIGIVLQSATAVKAKGQQTRLILPEEQRSSCFSSRSKL